MIDALIGSIGILTDRGINAFGYSSSFLEGRSPPRNCSHQALPFVEAAAKAKLAGGIETHPRGHLAALSAFRIVDVPIIAARNKNVRRKRVVFCFHCGEFGLDITYRRGEPFQCILKARCPHAVQSNISAIKPSSLQFGQIRVLDLGAKFERAIVFDEADREL
jgi:hypothetical protein